MISEYCFDELVIAGSLESLLYCFFNDKKLILLDKHVPFKLSTIPYHEKFRMLGYSSDDVIYKQELWDRLAFVLSMTNNIVCPNIVKSSRDSDGEVILVTDHNKRIRLFCDSMIQFDSPIENSFFVYDWFNVRSGNNHKFTILHDNDIFVNQIIFYQSERIGGNKNMKDLVAVSTLTKSQLQDINFCEGIARIKILKMMKSVGIRGQSNGISKLGYKLHYALKIEHTHRETIQNYDSMYDINTILLKEPTRGDKWNITKKLFRHKQISTLQESFRLPANL